VLEDADIEQARGASATAFSAPAARPALPDRGCSFMKKSIRN
jgi:hypothetical protein